jgi:broad specificity phosphatase PhoE
MQSALPSALTLVRHGQAQLFSTNYDQLSELGILQCQQLGAHWRRQRAEFDAVFCGPAQRHRHSAELLLEAMGRSREWEVIPAFDELPFSQVAKQGIPQVIANQPHLASLADRLQVPEENARAEQFQTLFLACLGGWMDESVPYEDTESFQQFVARVTGALKEVSDKLAQYRSILVVTSAGPIAASAAHVLQAPAATLYSLIWQSRNSSYTRFQRDAEGRMSMSEFNAGPHLTDPEWVTYF